MALTTQQAWFQQNRALAEQGDREAQYWTGDCYFHGKGVRLDRNESLHCFARMYLLGLSYLNGNGINHQNEGQALYWMQRAARREHPAAQLWIGQGYQSGWYGLPLNPRRAFEWFDRAAETENTGDGSYHLGRCYHYGIGVQRDLIQALHFYELARSQSSDDWMQPDLRVLRREIKRTRRLLGAHVIRSLHGSPPPGVWAHGLAKLATQQPAGLTPTFLVLSELVGQGAVPSQNVPENGVPPNIPDNSDQETIPENGCTVSRRALAMSVVALLACLLPMFKLSPWMRIGHSRGEDQAAPD